MNTNIILLFIFYLYSSILICFTQNSIKTNYTQGNNVLKYHPSDQSIPDKIISNFNEDLYFTNKITKDKKEEFIKKTKPRTTSLISIGPLLNQQKNKLAISFEYPIKAVIDISNTDVGIKLGGRCFGMIDKQGVHLDTMIFIQGILQIQLLYLNIGYCMLYKNLTENLNHETDNEKFYRLNKHCPSVKSATCHLNCKPTPKNQTLYSEKFQFKPFISCNIHANITKKIKLNIEIGYIKNYGFNLLFSLKR